MRQRGDGYRTTRVSDGQGGWLTGREQYAVQVRCQLSLGGRSEGVDGQRERAEVTGRLFVPLDVDVRRDDWWIVDGRTVRVDSVEPPGGASFAGAGGQQRCIVTEIQHGASTLVETEGS
jgi:hypothetical protein